MSFSLDGETLCVYVCVWVNLIFNVFQCYGCEANPDLLNIDGQTSPYSYHGLCDQCTKVTPHVPQHVQDKIDATMQRLQDIRDGGHIVDYMWSCRFEICMFRQSVNFTGSKVYFWNAAPHRILRLMWPTTFVTPVCPNSVRRSN
jgi:hypothetical protein